MPVAAKAQRRPLKETTATVSLPNPTWHYRMNDLAGSAASESVSGLTMGPNGSPGSTTGIIATCRTFDSTLSQYFNRAVDNAAFQLGSSGTIAMWVKITDKTLQRAFLCRGQNTTLDYYLFYQNGSPGPSTDRIEFYYNTSTGATAVVTIVTSPVAGTWYCIAVKWDGADIYVSVNGAAWTAAAAETRAPLTNLSAATLIGAATTGGGAFTAYHTGDIDAATHWKGIALTDAQIAAFYNSGTGTEFDGTNWV